MFVKPCKSKVPAGVKSALLDFVELLARLRQAQGLTLAKPWIFHTDQGGEFTALDLAEWIADNGGVYKPAPKGAHVAAAEAAVRQVLQGLRVSLYAAGLSPKFWPYAARSWVFNRNVEFGPFKELLRSENSPHEAAIFGRLIYFKPDEDRSKGLPTTCPGAFLGYATDMRRGAWVAFAKPDGAIAEYRIRPDGDSGALGVTSTDCGRTGSGLVWSPPCEDGRPRMAFRIVVQDLREISVRHDEDVQSGAPGLNKEELAEWIRKNPLPVRLVDASSSCPACRGRHRAHTYAGTCLQAGLTVSQRKEFRALQQTLGTDEQKMWLGKVRARNLAPSAEDEKLHGAVGVQDLALRAVNVDRPSEGGERLAPLSDLEACKEVDFCGGLCSTCDCKLGTACQAAFSCAAAQVSSPGVYASEPDPEPSIAELEGAVLECASAAASLESALHADGVPSPRSFALFSSCAFIEEPEPCEEPSPRSHASHAPAPRFFGAAEQCAFVVRKMTAAEKDGAGRDAIAKETFKLVEHGLFAAPCSASTITDPEATVSGMAMLGHVKHAERALSEQVFKGRAVVLGDVIRYILSGEIARMPNVEIGEVSTLEEVRAVVAWAALLGCEIETVDLENGYLNAEFEYPHYLRLPGAIIRELPSHLRPPPGMRDPVWKMCKAGYGHPVSGHIFIAKLRRFLLETGWKLLEGSSVLYQRGQCLLAAYVDDIACAGPSSELAELWRELGSAFKFKAEPSSCQEFLGIRVEPKHTEGKRVWVLSLADYIYDTVDSFEKAWKCTVQPSRTPGTDCVRSSTAGPTDPVSLHRIQVMIGRLLWIARTCRPDLSQLASALGSRVARWGPDCDAELKRTMGYLRLTASRGLVFSWLTGCRDLAFDLHSDSDWVAPRSQSGFLFVVSRPGSPDRSDSECFLPLHYASKKQPLSADSSSAAELIAAHFAVRSVAPLSFGFGSFVRERGFKPSRLRVLVDNSTCYRHIATAASDAFFVYAKALNLRLNLLTQLREFGFLDVAKVGTHFNRADTLTKTFPAAEFAGKARLVGVEVSDLCTVFRSGRVARAALWLRATRLARGFAALFE